MQLALSLEIGLAYGVSTMFICEAIQQLPAPGRHIVMDPYQHGKWRGIGLKNVIERGLRVDHRLPGRAVGNAAAATR